MSLITFELKKEHIELLKNLRWNLQYGKSTFISQFIENDTQELANIYEEVDLILNGKPSNFDPLNTEFKDYTSEQKLEWDKLLSELPTALDIVLFTNSFELGHYRTKYNIRSWKKN
jgi:hypothetical protein